MDVQDLYSENCKTQKKETEEDTNKWKHILCSWIGIINITKMPILPKAIYRFKAILIKIPMTYLHRSKTNNPKFIWNKENALNSLNNLEKEQSWRNHAI